MKIVHVEDFIHPDAGYQVNMLARLQVTQGHKVDIVTGELDKMPDILTHFFGRDNIKDRDALYHNSSGVMIHRIPLHGFYSGRAIFHTIKLFRKVRELKPDVVFVHGEDTLTGILFILLSKWLPYPIVLDCHMVEMASLNPYREYFRFFYRRFVTPIIIKRNIPFIRVVDSNFVEKCLGIPLERTRYLSLGTDTSYFKPNIENRLIMREKLGLSPSSFVVIYAGKLDENKGGLFLSEALLKKLHGTHGELIEFIIIGNTVGEYGAKVERNLSISDNHIVRLPTQSYFDLLDFYQAADLSIFPKQCSMSFFEAQACGLPVLFEENEINNIRVGNGNSFTFEPGSIVSFREKLVSLASRSPSERDFSSKMAREYVLLNYDFVPIAKEYSSVLNEAIVNWKY